MALILELALFFSLLGGGGVLCFLFLVSLFLGVSVTRSGSSGHGILHFRRAKVSLWIPAGTKQISIHAQGGSSQVTATKMTINGALKITGERLDLRADDLTTTHVRRLTLTWVVRPMFCMVVNILT